MLSSKNTIITILVILPSIGGLIVLILSVLGPAWTVLSLLYSGAYFYIALFYGISAVRIKTEEDFKKRGFDALVIEFEIVKKILIVTIPILGVLTVYIFLEVTTSFLHWNTDGLSSDSFFLPVFYLQFLVYDIVIGAGLRFLTQIAKKEFRFYLAKGYCIIATKKEDEFEKSRYLSLALESYNKYVRRRSEVEIKDIKKIYSRFLYADDEEKNQIIKSICESLEGDRLKLARYLSSVYKVPETEFFVSESITQKLEKVGTLLVVAIPIIISIIQFYISATTKSQIPPT